MNPWIPPLLPTTLTDKPHFLTILNQLSAPGMLPCSLPVHVLSSLPGEDFPLSPNSYLPRLRCHVPVPLAASRLLQPRWGVPPSPPAQTLQILHEGGHCAHLAHRVSLHLTLVPMLNNSQLHTRMWMCEVACAGSNRGGGPSRIQS